MGIRFWGSRFSSAAANARAGSSACSGVEKIVRRSSVWT